MIYRTHEVSKDFVSSIKYGYLPSKSLGLMVGAFFITSMIYIFVELIVQGN